MKISELLKTIETTAGSNDKIAIMKNNLNDTVKLIYEDCYNKYRNYGVKKFNVHETGTFTIDDDYNVFHSMLDILNNREVTGNAAIEMVESVIGKFTDEDQEILTSIINRKLTNGIAKNSFDKLLGTEKPKEFEVTLAYLLDKVKCVNPVDGTWYASRKCDGCVSGDTIVEFENGLKMPISEVVNNRMKGKIKSYDEKTNQIVYKEIEDWFHNVEDVDKSQKQWYEIALDDGKILKITGNDSLYVNGKGWTRIDELTEDDEILVE